MFEPDKIGEWDAFFFETTGDLTKPGPHNDGQPISAAGEKALYEAVRSGKGFLGVHCATDTFGPHRGRGTDDPYVQMIGGYFGGHGPQQVAKLEINDAAFPAAKGFGTGTFEINDEWYNNVGLADDLHVIFTHVTEGMKGDDYKRPNYPRPGLACTARAASSTLRWAIVKTSGRTPSSRACSSAPSRGPRAKLTPTSPRTSRA